MWVQEGDGDNPATTKQVGPADAQVDGREDNAGKCDSKECGEDRERGEYNAGVCDADMQLDVDKQMKKAETLLRKQSILAQQTLEHEERVRAADPEGMSNYRCRASREECRRNMQDLKKTLGSAKLKKMQDELDGAMRALERTAVPPSGMTSADWVRLATGEKTLVVPTGQDLMSAFDVSLWSSMDPKCFVYGDGVWGIQRAGKITFREHCAYLAERDELVYPDPPSVDNGNIEHGDEEPKPRGVCFVSISYLLYGLFCCRRAL